MAVPYTFGTATSAIPLSQLDSNFSTPITLGNTAIQLGNVVTTLNNMTLANVTISSGSITIPYANANAVVYTNSSNVATTSTALTFDGTNLGVGPTSPVAKLDVLKTPNDTISRTNAAGGFGDWSSLGAGLLLQQTLSSPYGFALQAANAANSVQFPLLLNPSGGNVGIGTSSPGVSLDVYKASGPTFKLGASGGNLQIACDGSTGSYYVNSGAFAHIWQVSSATKMTLDSSGNLGLGVTPSAWQSIRKAIQVGDTSSLVYGNNQTTLGNNVYINSSGQNTYIKTGAYAQMYIHGSGGEHLWFNAPSGTAGNPITFTQAMTLDASGNLLLGSTSNSLSARFISENASGNQLGLRYTSIATYYLNVDSGGNLTFAKDGSERARIDSSGNLLVGSTTSSLTSGVGIKQYPDGRMGCVINDATTGTNSYHLYNTNATNNGYRFYVNVNGGINNYSANNVNLSDRREKTDFAPAGEYLSKICAIPVQTYKYIDQHDDELTLGVVAQDVQEVAPELVTESNWGTEEEPKMRLSIYQTDLQYALMKCIQEQQALITQLTERITALEGAK